MTYPDEQNLTSLAKLKPWLDIPDTDSTADLALTGVINRVSAFVCKCAGRPQIKSAQYTEVRDGNGQSSMFMNVRPVTAVSLVQVGSVVVPARPASSPYAYGYAFDRARVVLVGYLFCWGLQNVTITYTGGVQPTDPDWGLLEQAALSIIADWWKRRGKETMVSAGANGVNQETFQMTDIPESAQSLISNVKNVVPPW